MKKVQLFTFDGREKEKKNENSFSFSYDVFYIIIDDFQFFDYV